MAGLLKRLDNFIAVNNICSYCMQAKIRDNQISCFRAYTNHLLG